jgi:transcription initiation factor TFIIF subunit beta
MYRAHWRHQACQILNITESDIPEDIITELKCYPWPTSLETKRADYEAWVVKVPKFVGRTFQEAANKKIGKLRIYVDPFENDPSKKLKHSTVELTGKEAADVPKQYVLANQPSDVVMHVFQDVQDATTSEHKIALEGKVKFKLDMRPRSIDDADYHRVSKERMVQAQTKTRVTQSSTEMRFVPLPKARNLIRFTESAIAEKAEKKERMEKKALEDKLFGLFERQPYWSLKQLLLETKQPADWLKSNLGEIAVLSRRGPNMGLWGLKDEWKNQSVKE